MDNCVQEDCFRGDKDIDKGFPKKRRKLTVDSKLEDENPLNEDNDIDADMLEEESNYFCILCSKHFLFQEDMLQHELKDHFAWTVKSYNLSLLYILIRIIRVDSKIDTAVNLRAQLETALDNFEKVYDKDMKCLECEYLSRHRDDLIAHYKTTHISEDFVEDIDLEPDKDSAQILQEDPKEARDLVGQNTTGKGNEEIILDGTDKSSSHTLSNTPSERTEDCSYQCDTSSDASFGTRQPIDSFCHISTCATCGLPVPGQPRPHECPAEIGCQDQAHKGKPMKKRGKTCQMCEFNCTKVITMVRHKALMHSKQNCPFPQCVHTDNNRLKLRAHIRNQHKNMCHVCAHMPGKQDKNLHNCAEHILKPWKGKLIAANPMLVVIPTQGRPFGCPWCFKFIQSTWKWPDHRQRCKLAPPKPTATKAPVTLQKKRSSLQSVHDISLCKTCGLPVLQEEEMGDFHQCPAQLGSKQISPGVKFKSTRLEHGDTHCNLCGFECSADNTMLRHRALMHRKQNCPSPTCIAMPEPNRPALQAHIKSKHPEMCSICGYISKGNGDGCPGNLLFPMNGKSPCTKESTNIMIRDMIPPWVRPGACPTCFKFFSNRNNLLQHLKKGCSNNT